MAYTGRRSTPLPARWQATRRRILRRDGGRCTRCGDQATDVDHVIPAAQGGSDSDDNLTSLCGSCHASKTGREARAAQPSRKRPDTDAHPGATARGGGVPKPLGGQDRQG